MGTGTGDIVKLCNEAGLTEPEFVQEEFFRVIIWRKKLTTGEDTGQDTGQDDSNLMMVISAISGEMKRVEIQDNLGIRHRETLFDNYLNPAIDKGLVEMTIPDKPTSKNQKYRLTAKGKALKKKKV